MPLYDLGHLPHLVFSGVLRERHVDETVHHLLRLRAGSPRAVVNDGCETAGATAGVISPGPEGANQARRVRNTHRQQPVARGRIGAAWNRQTGIDHGDELARPGLPLGRARVGAEFVGDKASHRFGKTMADAGDEPLPRKTFRHRTDENIGIAAGERRQTRDETKPPWSAKQQDGSEFDDPVKQPPGGLGRQFGLHPRKSLRHDLVPENDHGAGKGSRCLGGAKAEEHHVRVHRTTILAVPGLRRVLHQDDLALAADQGMFRQVSMAPEQGRNHGHTGSLIDQRPKVVGGHCQAVRIDVDDADDQPVMMGYFGHAGHCHRAEDYLVAGLDRQAGQQKVEGSAHRQGHCKGPPPGQFAVDRGKISRGVMPAPCEQSRQVRSAVIEHHAWK